MRVMRSGIQIAIYDVFDGTLVRLIDYASLHTVMILEYGAYTEYGVHLNNTQRIRSTLLCYAGWLSGQEYIEGMISGSAN